MVEQLGFFTSAPSQPRESRWTSMRSRWSPLTSGIVERDVLGHPVVRGVRGDHVARLTERGFDAFADRRGERGEQQRNVVGDRVGFCSNHLEVRDGLGDRGVDPPLRGVPVGVAGAVVAGGETGDLELGMGVEELNEALADGSGRAEDSDSRCHSPR